MQLTSVTLAAALIALLSASPLVVVAAPSADADADAVANPKPPRRNYGNTGKTVVHVPYIKRAAVTQDDDGLAKREAAAQDGEGADDDDDDGIDVADVELDTPELVARATRHCANQGRIKRNKAKYKGRCQRKDSLGYKSSHNCASRGGRSYLCVQGQKATCYSANLRSLNFENGECFK
jgi:hypothetical protein